MTTKQLTVLQLLDVYTAGRFDFAWSLLGPAKASVRAHIMSTIKGRKTPQSQSGVTALRVAIYDLFEINGACEANREDNFVIAVEGWLKRSVTGNAVGDDRVV